MINNTIIAGQTAGGDTAGPFAGLNNVIGGDPMLAPLGDYGGPTPPWPRCPAARRSAAGAAGVGIPTTDQRGFARRLRSTSAPSRARPGARWST